MSLHRLSLYLLYALTTVMVIYCVSEGGSYYELSDVERPHHPLHQTWKPGGVISHGFGIVGSLMMITLLLYIARKRLRFMSNWGNLRYWLNYHIWLGVTGPLLVLFHTTFKFGGIVSVSFWSMVAVVLSGVIGRYIYVQIPRSLTGQELSRTELEQLDRELLDRMSITHGVDANVLVLIREATAHTAGSASELGAIWLWLTSDVSLWLKLRRLRSRLIQSGELGRRDIRRVLKFARQRARLDRKIRFLSTAHSLLHHWHVFHKPFAIIMLVIMVVHVAVTVVLGYRWIF